MLRYRTLVLCALLVLVAACRREPRGEQAAREAGLNVLLVTIDTLRADALGSYGNTRAATPILDRLAAGGVRFSHARAHTVVTLPSHANILSGRYPFRHGVRENAGFRFPASMETLATLLKARGYRTGAFVSAFPLDRRFGLDRGFDIYDDRYGKSGEHDAFRVPERSAVDTASAALAWIGAAPAPSPYFAWVHVYEPHFPYAPPEPFASRFPQSPMLCCSRGSPARSNSSGRGARMNRCRPSVSEARSLHPKCRRGYIVSLATLLSATRPPDSSLTIDRPSIPETSPPTRSSSVAATST